jgi:hypothetical protein
MLNPQLLITQEVFSMHYKPWPKIFIFLLLAYFPFPLLIRLPGLPSDFTLSTRVHINKIIILNKQFHSFSSVGRGWELMFLFTTASRMALGLTQPPIQWLPGALSLEVRQPGLEADHSPPFNAEVKECMELYLHSPICLHGVALS